MSFNLLNKARIRNCTDCVNDRRAEISYIFDESSNFKGLQDVENITCILVDGDHWFGVSSGSSCFVGFISDLYIDAFIYDLIEISLGFDYYSINRPTEGKIQFKKENDSSWVSDNYQIFNLEQDNYRHIYTVDLSTNRKWEGKITNIRLFPFIDGAAGHKIFIKSIKFKSKSKYLCASKENGIVCNKYHLYEHPCPWIGAAEKVKSQKLTIKTLEVQKDYNDYIYINIAGFGHKKILLPSGTIYSLDKITRIIERELNLVSISGYFNAKCYMEDNSVVIEAGTRGKYLPIEIQNDGQLCQDLGFWSGSTKVYTNIRGEDPATQYQQNPVQLSLSDKSSFLSSGTEVNQSNKIQIGGDHYFPEAGRSDYAETLEQLKVDFDGKTVIDLNNPVTSNGILSKVYFVGNLYEDSKFFVFRKKLDGSLKKVYSLDISESSNIEDGIFEKDISIRVCKGDFIGFYSVAFSIGSVYHTENFSYYEKEGEPLDLETYDVISGEGEAGFPFYCRGLHKANRAVLDILFEEPQPIESFELQAEYLSDVHEFNVCKALSGGLNGGIYIDSTTGLDSEGNQAPGLTGLSNLIDGQKYRINGSLPFCAPEWASSTGEITGPNLALYGYTDFSIIFDFVKNNPTLFSIFKINLYFVDPINIKSFFINFPKSFSLDGDHKVWDTIVEKYNQVYLDGVLADEEHYIYNNPALVEPTNYHIDKVFLRYKSLSLEFDPVKARSMQYFVGRGEFANDDFKSETYNKFIFAPSPRISEIEVYFRHDFNDSVAGVFSLDLKSLVSSEFYTTNSVSLLDSGSVSAIPGKPSDHYKLTFESDSLIFIHNIFAKVSASDVEVNGCDHSIVKLNPPLKNYEDLFKRLEVINTSEGPERFYIQIENDPEKKEKLILWNKLSEEDYLSSEVGGNPLVTDRKDSNLRHYDYALHQPAYFFRRLLTTATTYVSYDSGNTIQCLGNLLVNGDDASYITNETEYFHAFNYVYVYIDLHDFYTVQSVSCFTKFPFNSFSSSALYSKDDVDSAELVSDGSWTTSGYQVRWVRLRASTAQPGASNKQALSFVKIDFDVFNNVGRDLWSSAEGKLTDHIFDQGSLSGESTTTFKKGDSLYYCVDLGGFHNVTGVYLLPSYGATNLLDEDYKGISVSFSSSNVSDPNKVKWLGFNQSYYSPIRWVLVKSREHLSCGEDCIYIEVENNNPENKISFFTENSFSSDLGAVAAEYGLCKDGYNSAKVTYSPNILGEDLLKYEHPCGYVPDLARRDYFGFWFYVSDLDRLDPINGYFKLCIPAEDSLISNFNALLVYKEDHAEKFYKWTFSDVFDKGVQVGWNFIKLPLSDNFKYGDTYLSLDDPSLVGQERRRDYLNGVEIKLNIIDQGKEFFICFDNFQFIKNKFISCHNYLGTYLPNTEQFSFILEDYNPYKGTVGFYLKPDWAKSPMCNSCEDGKDHAIFRIHGTGSSYALGLFMTGDGLKFYVDDGSNHLTLFDNTDTVITQDSVAHMGVVWDLSSEYSKHMLKIFINGVLTSSFSKTEYDYNFNFLSSDLYSLYLGGVLWSGIANEYNSSVDGVLEDLKVFNYPLHSMEVLLNNEGLESVVSSSELVEISLDGLEYYSIFDFEFGEGLLTSEIGAGESFYLYIKARNMESVNYNQNNRLSGLKISKLGVL